MTPSKATPSPKPATPAHKASADQAAPSKAAPKAAEEKAAPKVAKKPASKVDAKPVPKPVPPPDYDEKFLAEQRSLLEVERATYMEQAQRLREEAEQLAQDTDPGETQFDEESGEGGASKVDREVDLMLSENALAEVEEIDLALSKIESRTYGLCETCHKPIPKQRLKAIPQARQCVACKSGSILIRR